MRSFALLLVGVVALDAHGMATLDEDEHDDVREEDEEQSLSEVSATEQAEIASLQKKMDAQIAAIAATHAEIERVQEELLMQDDKRCCIDFTDALKQKTNGDCPPGFDFYFKKGKLFEQYDDSAADELFPKPKDGTAATPTDTPVEALPEMTLNGVCCEGQFGKLRKAFLSVASSTDRCDQWAIKPDFKNVFGAVRVDLFARISTANLIWDKNMNARMTNAAKTATQSNVASDEKQEDVSVQPSPSGSDE